MRDSVTFFIFVFLLLGWSCQQDLEEFEEAEIETEVKWERDSSYLFERKMVLGAWDTEKYFFTVHDGGIIVKPYFPSEEQLAFHSFYHLFGQPGFWSSLDKSKSYPINDNLMMVFSIQGNLHLLS